MDVIVSGGKGKGNGVNEESPGKGDTSKEGIPRSAIPTGQRSTRNDSNINT